MVRISNLGKNMQCKGLAKFLTDSRYQSMALRLPRGRSLTRRPGRLKEEMSRDNIVKKQTITQAKKVLDESPLCSLPLPFCACCILLPCSLQVISLGTTSWLYRSRYATCYECESSLHDFSISWDNANIAPETVWRRENTAKVIKYFKYSEKSYLLGSSWTRGRF